MWVGFLHGKRLRSALDSFTAIRDGENDCMVIGGVWKSSKSISCLRLVQNSLTPPYRHFMEGALYFGELRFGLGNSALYQNIVVSDSRGTAVYVEPTWSLVLNEVPDHDWIRVTFKVQSLTGHMGWMLVDSVNEEMRINLLWYFPSDGTFKDVHNLTEYSVSSSVLVIHLNDHDVTYFACLASCLRDVSR